MSTTTAQRRIDAPRPVSRPARRPVSPRRVVGRVVSGALVAFLLVIVVGPLIWMVLGSFKTQTEFLENPVWMLPQQWNLDNYVFAWTTGNFAQYAFNSVVTVIPSLFLVLLLGSMAGFALEVLVWKGRGAILLTFLAGIMVPTQMILLPLFAAYFRTGLTGTLWPLIITYTATSLPLTVFLMATFFRAVPREVFEAATLDGASIIRSFFLVGLPMVRNALFTVGLVQFFMLWNDLLIALTFTNSGSLRTLQVGLLNFTGQFGSVQYGPLFAAICLNVIGILVIYLFLNKQVQKGLTAGAVKG
ncbi:raffinose/stachyose/melibiose transport system permease protein [Clavibacter michiganensis]|uniref:carbohydrate ABC transporter permease n=1 Tax=Clavibacter michiganensis TaxID=28447 RepID=UPI001AE34045|nr:carbohydrate ABC transporter permease [Clavibacter michiganensis]MBP2456844.1 raffinose/stachyose/melibiose transport system permease protein [Clavibacter michiganensis]MDQ0409414.1 raffinose/stachyose/melibiose transport system permease protein [Clavibacter michiganensis]